MKKRDFFSGRTKEISNSSYKRRMLFSFILFGVLVAIGIFAWKWLNRQTTEQMALKPLRKTLELNERLLKSTFDTGKLSKVYTEKDAVKNVRVNGLIGIQKAVDTSTWRLQVVRANGDTLKLSLPEIEKLPKVDVIFDFKCIEGWSQVTHWAGVPLKTFMEYYHLNAQEKMNYVGLQTVDKKYYVGIDMPSA